jgi:hypothetical protein
MGRSPSSETASCEGIQALPKILRKPKFQYPFYKSYRLAAIASQISAVNITPLYQ